jgi:hypothetical protein
VPWILFFFYTTFIQNYEYLIKTSWKFPVELWLSSTNTWNIFYQANITSVL